MLTTQWQWEETDANIPLMAQTLGISPITARVMANRQIRTKNTAKAFLQPSVADMGAFVDLKDGAQALARIAQAITAKEAIVIFGDYDADGVTSTAILYKVLTRLGAHVSYYIPHRITEGYGLNKHAVAALAQKGTRLLVTVDNGISAIEEVALATTLGMDTIIIDHHEPGDALPKAAAIVDPKQKDCPYPFKELCAGGLAYKLAEGLCQYMHTPFTEQAETLALAAIATICDIVPLHGENRILANCGMAILNEHKLINPGLGTLIGLRGYLEKPLDPFTVGFVLGPCINAPGRLTNGTTAVELLTAPSEDIPHRVALAQSLMQLNEDRKTLTADATARLLESLPQTLDNVLVLVDKDIHESIGGIVAGRIKEHTGRPTIVFAQGEDAMKGSGRSIPHYNLFQALNANSHLFTRFGGHAMAAGLTMTEANIPLLRDALNATANLTPTHFHKIIPIDQTLTLSDITLPLAEELSRLAPFGAGNQEPLFATHNLFAENVRILDEKSTLIFTLADNTGRKIKAIAFGLNEAYATQTQATNVNKLGGFPLDIAYAIEINVYNNIQSLQLRLRDFVIG